MKLYISGKMTGVDDFNEPAFRSAAKRLRELGHSVIVPHELDATDKQDTWGANLGRDVRIIADSELTGIAMLDNWWTSRGARLEIFEAMLLGLALYRYDAVDGTLAKVQYELVFEILKDSLLEVVA